MKIIMVELEKGVYLADWEGDPGRTLKIDNAKTFNKLENAEKALEEARKYRPFTKGRILNLSV